MIRHILRSLEELRRATEDTPVQADVENIIDDLTKLSEGRHFFVVDPKMAATVPGLATDFHIQEEIAVYALSGNVMTEESFRTWAARVFDSSPHNSLDQLVEAAQGGGWVVMEIHTKLPELE